MEGVGEALLPSESAVAGAITTVLQPTDAFGMATAEVSAAVPLPPSPPQARRPPTVFRAAPFEAEPRAPSPDPDPPAPAQVQCAINAMVAGGALPAPAPTLAAPPGRTLLEWWAQCFRVIQAYEVKSAPGMYPWVAANEPLLGARRPSPRCARPPGCRPTCAAVSCAGPGIRERMEGAAATTQAQHAVAQELRAVVRVGFRRIVASCHRSSSSYHIC
jgi:hypothetical protein